MAKKLLIVLFILGLSMNGLAQQVTSKAQTTVYVIANDLNVRETPPSKGLILIGGPGKVAFDLKKDASVIVLEQKVIESVFDKTIWVRIKDLDSKKEGWIYWGDDEKKSVNLKIKEVK
jgi:hypothetical protein